MVDERTIHLVPEEYQDGILGVLEEKTGKQRQFDVVKFTGDPNHPSHFPERDSYEVVNKPLRDLFTSYPDILGEVAERWRLNN